MEQQKLCTGIGETCTKKRMQNHRLLYIINSRDDLSLSARKSVDNFCIKVQCANVNLSA